MKTKEFNLIIKYQPIHIQLEYELYIIEQIKSVLFANDTQNNWKHDTVHRTLSTMCDITQIENNNVLHSIITAISKIGGIQLGFLFLNTQDNAYLKYDVHNLHNANTYIKLKTSDVQQSSDWYKDVISFGVIPSDGVLHDGISARYSGWQYLNDLSGSSNNVYYEDECVNENVLQTYAHPVQNMITMEDSNPYADVATNVQSCINEWQQEGAYSFIKESSKVIFNLVKERIERWRVCSTNLFDCAQCEDIEHNIDDASSVTYKFMHVSNLYDVLTDNNNKKLLPSVINTCDYIKNLRGEASQQVYNTHTTVVHDIMCKQLNITDSECDADKFIDNINSGNLKLDNTPLQYMIDDNIDTYKWEDFECVKYFQTLCLQYDNTNCSCASYITVDLDSAFRGRYCTNTQYSKLYTNDDICGKLCIHAHMFRYEQDVLTIAENHKIEVGIAIRELVKIVSDYSTYESDTYVDCNGEPVLFYPLD